LFGVFFLHVKIDPATANWPLFFLTLVLGVVMLALMGLALAGVLLLLAHHSWGIGDAIGGALFLFSGAIFPLSILPRYLQPIGYVMPITYWLELLRRALVGSVAEAFPTLIGWSNLQLFAMLFGLTLLFGMLSGVVFRWCEQRARELGRIDMVTNY
jgi:ABC-2 type transport system permease protein